VTAPLLDIVDLHDNRRIPLNKTQRESRRGPYPYYGANGQVDTIDDYLFDGDYILVAEDGGYFDDPTRSVAYEASGKFWVNNHAHILAVRGRMPRRFLTYALNDLDWMKYVGGSTRLKLAQAGMRKIDVLLPPLSEQSRIANKLDRLSARTRRSREELDRIPLLIEHYKRAILTAAFRGDLSADWRATHLSLDTDRPVDGLPQGWKTKELHEVAEIQSGLALGKKRKSGDELVEVPYLRVANVQRGHLDLEEVKTLRATRGEIDRLLLKPGDILMNEGGDRDKLGRGWIWSGEVEPCIHQNHVFRVRLYDVDFSPKYISYFANEFGQDYFFDEGTQTTNLASISKTKVSALPLPIPSSAEANEIVARIEAAFRWIEALTNDVDRAGQQLSRLDRSISRKALRGQLLPQDPNDESAGVLLERIRNEGRQTLSLNKEVREGEQENQTRKTKRKGKKIMGKKRADVERDHLRKTLNTLGGTANARELWRQSDMDIDEFYKQLRQEMKSGHISEGASKDQLVLADAA
jgi:type I restriction enzyme S subunit